MPPIFSGSAPAKLATVASLWMGASLVLYALAPLIKEIAFVLPLILFGSLWLDFPRPLEPGPRGGGALAERLPANSKLTPRIRLRRSGRRKFKGGQQESR